MRELESDLHPMKAIHSGSCNVLAGGPALSTWLSIKGLRQNGVDTKLVMEPISEGKVISEELNPSFTDTPRFGTLGYVPNYAETLKKIGLPDIYHAQGIWMLHATQMANFARKNNIPYLVSLRGMLYPEALNHNKLIKKISLLTYQANTLKNASAIQATCEEEMKHYRNLGFKNPVAIIPNPIDISELKDFPINEKSKFTIGYLGRLHPRKRVERLIYAINNLKDKLPADNQLVIIGGGDQKYENFLKEEVKRLNLKNVIFKGFLTGKDKIEAIRDLSLLVVPSDFENFGNIVTEALALGVPVVASKGMPWKSLPENGCGWWINNDQTSIDETILNAWELGPAKLKEMGIMGRKFVEQTFSVEILGLKMKTLYEWILGHAPKPDFVYLD